MNYTVKHLCHDCTVASIYGIQARTNDPDHNREWLRAYTEAGDLEGVEEIRHGDTSVKPCQHCGGGCSEGAWDVIVISSLTTGGNK